MYSKRYPLSSLLHSLHPSPFLSLSPSQLPSLTGAISVYEHCCALPYDIGSVQSVFVSSVRTTQITEVLLYVSRLLLLRLLSLLLSHICVFPFSLLFTTIWSVRLHSRFGPYSKESASFLSCATYVLCWMRETSCADFRKRERARAVSGGGVLVREKIRSKFAVDIAG